MSNNFFEDNGAADQRRKRRELAHGSTDQCSRLMAWREAPDRKRMGINQPPLLAVGWIFLLCISLLMNFTPANEGINHIKLVSTSIVQLRIEL